LREMTDAELDLAWDLWFDLAQATNDFDPPYTHGAFVLCQAAAPERPMKARFAITDVVEIRSRGAFLIGVLSEGALEIGMRSEAVPLAEGPRELIVRSIDHVDDDEGRTSKTGKLALTFVGSPSVASVRAAVQGRRELRFSRPEQP